MEKSGIENSGSERADLEKQILGLLEEAEKSINNQQTGERYLREANALYNQQLGYSPRVEPRRSEVNIMFSNKYAFKIKN